MATQDAAEARQIEVKVLDQSGAAKGVMSVSSATLGGMVKKRLMHSAVVMYHANRRQGSACTRGRSEIAGSNKKLYRQKGTGRARAGSKKTNIRRGGGRVFGPKPRDFSYAMPKKQRRAALKSALLAKLLDDEVVVVESLGISEVKTKAVADLLTHLKLAGQKVLIATAESNNREVYLSGRNIDRVTVKRARDVNTLDLLACKKVLIERAELEALIAGPGAASSGADSSKIDAITAGQGA